MSRLAQRLPLSSMYYFIIASWIRITKTDDLTGWTWSSCTISVSSRINFRKLVEIGLDLLTINTLWVGKLADPAAITLFNLSLSSKPVKLGYCDYLASPDAVNSCDIRYYLISFKILSRHRCVRILKNALVPNRQDILTSPHPDQYCFDGR